MAIQLRRDAEAWRLPGCGERCQLRTAIVSDPHMRRIGKPDHDPDDHENYGRVMAGHADLNVVRTGPLSVDLTRQQATVAGRTVDLTRREWTVLEVLARARGGVVSAVRVMDAFEQYDPAAYSENALRVWVQRLRAKLGGAAYLICARKSAGYYLAIEPPTDTLPDRPAKRWAQNWDECQRCGTRERAHGSLGYCTTCDTIVRRHARQGGRR